MLVLNNSKLKYRNISNEIFDHGELKIAVDWKVFQSTLLGLKL